MNRNARAAFALSAAIIGAAAPAQADVLKLAYEIRLGGLSAGSVDLTVEFTADRYQISALTRSRGLVDMLVGFRSDARSEGARSGDALQPAAHRADNEWRGEARHVRIAYGADAPAASAEPPPERDDRDPVPAALTEDTLDPLTAALQAVLQAESGDACERRLDVFDGRRRYALHFEGRSREGETLRCKVRLERIAGMSHDPWLPIVQPIETAELWLAPIRPGSPPMPLRLQAETGFGTAVVRLTALDGAKP